MPHQFHNLMDVEFLGPLCDLTKTTPAETAQFFVKLCTDFTAGAHARGSFARSRSCNQCSTQVCHCPKGALAIFYDFLLRSESESHRIDHVAELHLL
jgi:hypothetical protein